jgi:Domain of unknown function (DUF4335)
MRYYKDPICLPIRQLKSKILFVRSIMESPNSPTSTYTTPTCTLNVSTKAKQLSHLQVQQPARDGDFVLEIDRDDRGELGRTTLQGDLQALDRLQLVVSNYIAEAIAKFPLPTTAPRSPQPPSPPIVDRAPDRELSAPPPSGLLKNLPGLRNSQARSIPDNLSSDRSDRSGHGKISKFIGFMSQHDRQNRLQQDLTRSMPQTSANPGARAGATNDTQTRAPYLTSGKNGSLDHNLHLGELATPESGEVQVLSAIQLFDLATVLDEYAATRVPTPNAHSGTKVHAQSLTAGGLKRAEVESTAASLSRLPNLPRIPAEPEVEPTQYRRRSRSGVMSVVPWAAGAAAIVGGAALMLGSGSNELLTSLKESIGKVKMPSFLTFERVEDNNTVASKPTGKKSDRASGTSPTNAPSVALPKPWQAQSVQPPTTPQTTATTTPTGDPTKTNIGFGTMPSSVSTTPVSKDLNPLIPGIDSGSSPTATTATPTTVAGATPTTTATQSVKTTAKPTNSGNISLSTQAIPILQDPIADINSTQRPKQVAIPTPATPAGGGIDPPAVIDPYAPKKTSKSAKSKTATNLPKIQASPNVPFLTPATTIEPKSYKPNPNLITPQPEKPVPPNTSAGSESSTPQTVPDRSTQANNGQVGGEAIENTSLKEAQRYFQGKWKATPTQTSVLQYVLDVNSKNGVVRSVNPQGEEANSYLKQSKLIKPGQKIVSPVAGSSDQKIRVLLHPDGNVDTFVEP